MRAIVLDLETAPALVYTFGLKDQNHGVEQVVYDQHCLMWVAKDITSKKMEWDTLPNHPKSYKKNPRNDLEIAKSLMALMDTVDWVISQNGDHFDLKWFKQLCLIHDLKPPKPFRSFDLLRESRSNFYSLSHKLDFRGRQLGLGGKQEHEGFGLWKKCLDGDMRAWDRMLRYCKRDVELAESYYYKIRPFSRNHPNLNMYNDQPHGGRLKCPVCLSSHLKLAGFRHLVNGRKQRFQCKSCGHYMVEANRPDTITKAIVRSD